MLNYKELSEKFTDILSEFDEPKLNQWLEFDKKRDLYSRIISGEKVKIDFDIKKPIVIVDPKEIINYSDNQNYSLAA